MARTIVKKLSLLLVSVFISGILCILIAEGIFYLTHGTWYRNKSYLVYRSLFKEGELAKLTENMYYSKNKSYPSPEEYKPLILKNIAGEFDISLLPKKILYDIRLRSLYDLVVSFWGKCIDPARVKLCLRSQDTFKDPLLQYKTPFQPKTDIKNSFITGDKIEEQGYTWFFVSIPFMGDADLWIENQQELTSCKGLTIFLKRHPSVCHYAKPKGSYRILVIGGSTSAWYGIHPWETYSFFLQKCFDAMFPGKVDVINLALPGGVLNDFLENLDFYRSLKPDMMIIAPVWNDIGEATDERFILKKKIVGNITYDDVLGHIRRSRFFSRYALGYYLYRLFAVKLSKEEGLLEADLDRIGAGGRLNRDLDTVQKSREKYWGVIEKRLDFLVGAFDKEKIKVVLVTLPSLSTGQEPTPEEKEDLSGKIIIYGDSEDFSRQLKLLDYFESIDKEIIQGVAQKRGATLVRCQDDPALKHAGYSVRKDYFGDHAHFNQYGSDLIGTIIFGKIHKIVEEHLKQPG